MPPPTRHPSPLLNDIARRRHRRRGQTNTITTRERQIVIRVRALDAVAAVDFGTVDGGHGFAVEDCDGWVAVGLGVGGEMVEFGFE